MANRVVENEVPGTDCLQSIEGGFRSGGNGARSRHPSVSRLTHIYSAYDFSCLFGFVHFSGLTAGTMYLVAFFDVVCWATRNEYPAFISFPE